MIERTSAQPYADLIAEPSETFATIEPAPINGGGLMFAAVADEPVAMLSDDIETYHAAPMSRRSERALDVLVGSALLLLVLPLMAACVLAVWLSSPGPVVFRQLRIGVGGREFTCFKLRTMSTGAEAAIAQLLVNSDATTQQEWLTVRKLSHDPRVTRVGRFLRRYCLDELPQLFNVLAGDMSVVGPRPIVSEEIHRYGQHFSDYCSVKPGLTGLWQISGRHALTYDQRVMLDAEYARSKSTRLDLLILLRTVPVVIFGQNA